MKKRFADKYWLLSKIKEDKNNGAEIQTYNIHGEDYYLIPCNKGKVLISGSLPSKKDWSLNMFNATTARGAQPPKNDKQYYWSVKDYRWQFHRQVVAADHIKGLPSIEEFIKR